MIKNKASKIIMNYTKKYYLNILLIAIFILFCVVLYNINIPSHPTPKL
jgi:hypothetical protein